MSFWVILVSSDKPESSMQGKYKTYKKAEIRIKQKSDKMDNELTMKQDQGDQCRSPAFLFLFRFGFL